MILDATQSKSYSYNQKTRKNTCKYLIILCHDTTLFMSSMANNQSKSTSENLKTSPGTFTLSHTLGTPFSRSSSGPLPLPPLYPMRHSGPPSLPSRSFRRYNSDTQENDIAVVKLNRPASFSDSIWPVCLPPAGEFYEGRSGYVTGEPEVTGGVEGKSVGHAGRKNNFVKHGLLTGRGDNGGEPTRREMLEKPMKNYLRESNGQMRHRVKVQWKYRACRKCRKENK